MQSYGPIADQHNREAVSPVLRAIPVDRRGKQEKAGIAKRGR